MDPGCLVCNNLFIYRYLNRTTRCPFCYLLVFGHHVFESLAQWFGSHASKTVVLGGSGPRTITVLEDKPDPYGPPVHPPKGENGRDMVAAKPKAARKTVSINHNVEYIEDYVSSSKKRKRKAMEQWPSMEIEGDELKPLKSILKVGSMQNMNRNVVVRGCVSHVRVKDICGWTPDFLVEETDSEGEEEEERVKVSDENLENDEEEIRDSFSNGDVQIGAHNVDENILKNTDESDDPFSLNKLLDEEKKWSEGQNIEGGNQNYSPVFPPGFTPKEDSSYEPLGGSGAGHQIFQFR
ncbi:hypothetical protein L6452_40202 [Arctium lappa]|uniref:Uncharacterized protein n=1 Tax=Arctium lappa TaxID=4217 RepID=A0ACB8XLH5_ARCLA|nr:hypothetical protein L6452_40202 [Arctium lappa]